VPPAQLVLFAVGSEQLLPIAVDRVEHREAVAVASHEVVLDEFRDRVDHSETDCLGGVERPAAGEDGEPLEQGARLGAEQVAAPGDRRAQGPLSFIDVAPRRGEHVEAVLEPSEQLRR